MDRQGYLMQTQDIYLENIKSNKVLIIFAQSNKVSFCVPLTTIRRMDSQQIYIPGKIKICDYVKMLYTILATAHLIILTMFTWQLFLISKKKKKTKKNSCDYPQSIKKRYFYNSMYKAVQKFKNH